jgi:hypothetical protein
LSSDQPHPTDEEFAMSTEHTAIPNPADAERERPAPADAQTLAGAAPAPAAEQAYAPLTDEWAQDDDDELPPRPRRRLLGKGGNPVQVALLGVLLLACGFIGGVLVEKGQTSSSASGAGGALASRFAALRSGASSAGGAAASSGAAASGGAGAATGGDGAAPGGFAGRFGGATIGEVAYIAGSTLYVTNAEGDTVKVKTSAASSITKTVKTDVHGIHPGETVIVRGTKGSNGAVSAESVSVGTSGAASGALGALFGGGTSAAAGGAGGVGGARSGAGGGTGGGGTGGGEPALFGK